MSAARDEHTMEALMNAISSPLFAELFFFGGIVLVSLFSLEWGVLVFLFLLPFVNISFLVFPLSHSAPLYILFFLLSSVFLIRGRLFVGLKRLKEREKPLLFACFAYLFFQSVSFLYHYAGVAEGDIPPSFSAFLLFVTGLLVFFLLVGLPIKRRLLLGAFFLGALVVSLLALAEFTGLFNFLRLAAEKMAVPVEQIEWGVSAGFTHKNVLGGYLALLLPSFLALWLAERGRWSLLFQSGYGIGFLLMLFALLASSSRGGWFGFGVGLLVFVFLYLFAERKALLDVVKTHPLRQCGNAFLVCMVFFIAGWGLGSGDEALRAFKNMDTLLHLSERTEEKNIKEMFESSRLLHLEQSALLAQEYPFSGVGAGRYPVVADVQRVSPDIRSLITLKNQNPHNYFLLILTEAGIFALLSFLFLLYFFLRRGAVLFFRSGLGRDEKLLVAGVISGITGYISTFMVDHTLGFTEMQFIFFAFVSLLFPEEHGEGK